MGTGLIMPGIALVSVLLGAKTAETFASQGRAAREKVAAIQAHLHSIAPETKESRDEREPSPQGQGEGESSAKAPSEKVSSIVSSPSLVARELA